VRVLVTGCEGMLGRAVLGRLQQGHETVGVDLADGNLADDRAVADIITRYVPEWVIHCAAWTDVDGAETSRTEAESANVTATENLARRCESTHCGLTYLSTDYVFAGGGQATGYCEEQERNPVNFYGLTKARGEEIVASLTTPWQIVRTSWLFGDGRVNFPKTIRRLLDERETLKVVDDQRGCPTYAEDLAAVLGFLVSGGHRGIFHGTNHGACSWFEFAREVAVGCGADPSRISACGSDEFPTRAVRPTCSILASRRLETAGCPDRPSWQDGLKRYLDHLDSELAVFP